MVLAVLAAPHPAFAGVERQAGRGAPQLLGEIGIAPGDRFGDRAHENDNVTGNGQSIEHREGLL
jgi:hypothetical protein